jgi:hypothetical protein
MPATDQYSQPSTTKARLAMQLKAWQLAEDNPMGEDGKPAPLRAIAIYVSNLPPDQNPFISEAINAKTDCTLLAHKIIQKMTHWINEMNQAGESLQGDMQPFFGSNPEPGQGHYGIRVKPNKQSFGNESPLTGDFRDSREAGAAIVREAISHGRDVTSFGGLLFSKAEERTDKIIESLENEIKNLREHVRELEAGRKNVAALEADLADKTLDRDMKQRKNNMELAVMESAGYKLIDYIPFFMSKIDEIMINKFGGPKQEMTDEGKFYKGIAETIFSKIQDKDTALKVFQALNLSKDEQVRLFQGASKLQIEEKRKAMHEEAASLSRGAPLRLLTMGARGIPTINTRRPKAPIPTASASSAKAEVQVKAETGTDSK